MTADRYDTSTHLEGQFQPGSNGAVLCNKLGITDSTEMDQLELELLAQLTEVLFNELVTDQPLSVADICEWHRRWLGNVYEWAGHFRVVNMGKGDFQFATARLIPELMAAFEKSVLAPGACDGEMTEDELTAALASVHTEFILVHPFREGNGRLSRLLAVIMALQAGRPVLDFSWLDQHKQEYFLAIQLGLDDLEPMKAVFEQVLRDTWKISE